MDCHPVTERLRCQQADDIAALVGAALVEGGLILTERELGPAFFDLRTGLAGELMQKFTNYNCCLALVIVSADRHGRSFQDLAREHRQHPLIRFFNEEDAAREWLRSQT